MWTDPTFAGSGRFTPIGRDWEKDKLTMDKLKSWRKEISQEQEIPAYCIVNNKSLLEIIKKKPISFEDLSNIYGIGEAKIEKYGSHILRIMNEN